MSEQEWERLRWLFRGFGREVGPQLIAIVLLILVITGIRWLG